MNLGGVISSLMITGPLCLGSKDSKSIKAVQQALNEKIGLMFGKIAEDGIFGTKTDQRVRIFQMAQSLKIDGIVGPITAGALGLLYTARAPVPAPPKAKPSGSGGQPVPPKPGGVSSAAGDLVEAVVQGLGDIQRGIVSALRELTPAPGDFLTELIQSIASRFSSTVASLRGAAGLAMRAGDAIAQVLSNSIRSALGSYVSSVQQALENVLKFIPDLLGLGGIAAKIRAMIQKLQNAVNHIIDLVIKAVGGAVISLIDAVRGIAGVLAGVASAA